MADRFWVGNSGNWSDNVNHWSATTGGEPGASLPTSSDNVYFDANSFTLAGQTVTVNTNANCLDMDWTGALNSPALAGSSNLVAYGNTIFISAMTDSMTGTKYLSGTGTFSLTTNGLNLSGQLGAKIQGTLNLQDDLTITKASGYIRIDIGCTFNTNNHNISCIKFYTNGAGLKTINLGSSTIICSGNFDVSTASTVLNAIASTIKLTGNSTTFAGGSLTYNNVEFTGTPITITGSNTFNELKLTAGKTVNFTAGTTQTITSLSGNGTSGNLITIQSTTAGSPFTLNKTSGILNISYYSIKDCTATGGATFNATDSTNVSGNSGWGFIVNASASISSLAIVSCSSQMIMVSILNSSANITATAIVSCNAAKAIKTGIVDGKVRAFEMGGYLYILDGTHYLRYGTTVVDVSTVATTPTLTMGRETGGGGTPLDQYNLLTPYFIDSFSPDGIALTYPMSLDGLDIDIPIVASVDYGLTYNKVETTHFTVDRDTGIVTWLSAPALGTDSMKIKAGKTVGTYEVVTIKITAAATASANITLSLNGVNTTVAVVAGDTVNDVAGKIRAATIANWTITGATDTAILTCKTAGAKVTSTFAGGTTGVTATVTIVKGTNSKADLIKKCTIFGKFGGANDTHVFFTGNPSVPNLDYRCEVDDPTNFSENGWTVIGDDTESVTGYTVQHDLQIIQRTSSKWSRQYVLSGGVASYPLKPVSAERGCTAPDSLQLVDNNPMCLDALGINTIESGQVRDERYTKHKSSAIDPDLTLETASPVSANYDNKYWLAFGDNVYVADYRHKYADEYSELQYEWFELFDLPITCFCEQGGYLYFGGQGLVYRFLKHTEANCYYDDGAAITCEFPFKIINFGTDELYKKVKHMDFTLKPDIHASADVYFETDEVPQTFLESIRMDLLKFSELDFGHFSFSTSIFPQPFTVDVGESKLSYFQYTLKNSTAGESMGVMRSEIHYIYQGRRR